MKKDREPEVGDIFEYKDTRYIVTEINNMGYIYISGNDIKELIMEEK